jgi:hypothetical protein
VYARNNNFKITLLNKYLIDSSSQNTPLMEQDVWKMPLFEETEKEVPFNHVFKANATFSWIQLRQRHPDSVSYYPNDTLAFPTNNDSLLSFLTFGGNYNHDYRAKYDTIQSDSKLSQYVGMCVVGPSDNIY